MKGFKMAQLVPPGNLQKQYGLHWLQLRSDTTEWVLLQWNPDSQTWTHSDCHNTSVANFLVINECDWIYHSHVKKDLE